MGKNKIAAPVYRDNFTLDGKLRPQAGVSREKVKAVKGLLESALSGNRRARADLMEAVTTTDAIVNVAHLFNLQVIPQLPKVTHNLDGIAGARTVTDFKPTVLYSLFLNNGQINYNESDLLKGQGLDQHGAALVVPEGQNYPIVSVTGGIESYYQKLSKRGARFDWSLEAQINDDLGIFASIPSEMLKLTVDTQYHELFDALLQAGTASEILGTAATIPAYGEARPMPDGTVVPANPKLSPYSVARAQQEISWRTINGRFIGEISDWTLFVAPGMKRYWDFQVQANLLQANFNAGTNAQNWFAGHNWQPIVGNVDPQESERLSGDEWYLVPKPGATARPVWERLTLAGYETPELRVNGLQGSYAGGGSISPFGGSFDSDTISLRYRLFTGGVLWSEAYIAHSDGSGGPITLPTSFPGTQAGS